MQIRALAIIGDWRAGVLAEMLGIEVEEAFQLLGGESITVQPSGNLDKLIAAGAVQEVKQS